MSIFEVIFPMKFLSQNLCAVLISRPFFTPTSVKLLCITVTVLFSMQYSHKIMKRRHNWETIFVRLRDQSPTLMGQIDPSNTPRSFFSKSFSIHYSPVLSPNAIYSLRYWYCNMHHKIITRFLWKLMRSNLPAAEIMAKIILT
jgi:hypothetical protein